MAQNPSLATAEFISLRRVRVHGNTQLHSAFVLVLATRYGSLANSAD